LENARMQICNAIRCNENENAREKQEQDRNERDIDAVRLLSHTAK
jgi:hypothetical protein